jgi:thiazole synthase
LVFIRTPAKSYSGKGRVVKGRPNFRLCSGGLRLFTFLHATEAHNTIYDFDSDLIIHSFDPLVYHSEGWRSPVWFFCLFVEWHYNRNMTDSLIIAGRTFRSRLIVGTGKYKSFQETARALEASGADMVTVAVRRVNLDRSKESLLDFIDPKKYFLLPNTAGCYTADEAVRAARLGREVGLSDWIKLEVIGDQATLYPDVQATLEATRILVKEGFTVLPYTSDDVVFAKRLLDAGASAIMPLGAPIGSGLGIQNAANIRILREVITGVPLIVDAGVGTASDAAVAMELGADAVLMNTGIANAQDPILMAEAMKHAVLAGREAYLAGRMGKKLYATASSPLEGLVR